MRLRLASFVRKTDNHMPSPDDMLKEANNPARVFCDRVAACRDLVRLVNAGQLLPAVLQRIDGDVYAAWSTGKCR
jgi:hypothetical protein